MDSDERFQKALERSLAGERAPLNNLSPEDRQAIDLACRLSQTPFTPRPAWQADLRRRLGRSSRTAPRRRWQPVLQAAGGLALLAGLVVVLGLALGSLRPQPGSPVPAGQPTSMASYPEGTLPGEGLPSTPTPAAPTDYPTEGPAEPAPTAAPAMPGLTPILYTVQTGDTLEKIAAETGASVEQLVGWNQSIDLKPDGSNLQVGSSLIIGYEGGSTGPLSLDSPHVDFRQRIVHPQWQSLWVEGIVTASHPDGSQQIAYAQAWLSRDGRGRVMSSDYYPYTPQGSPDTPVRWVAVSDGQRRVTKDLVTGETSDMPTQPGTNGAYQWIEHPLETSSPLTDMLFPFQFALLSSDVQVAQEANPAGRPAIEVKWGGATLWVDQETGVILREQQAQDKDGQTIQMDAVITHIVYDPALPEDVIRTEDLDAARFELPPDGAGAVLPTATPNSPDAAAQECSSYSLVEAQQAVGFTILAPSSVSNDLPLSQVNVCQYPA